VAIKRTNLKQKITKALYTSLTKKTNKQKLYKHILYTPVTKNSRRHFVNKR